MCTDSTSAERELRETRPTTDTETCPSLEREPCPSLGGEPCSSFEGDNKRAGALSDCLFPPHPPTAVQVALSRACVARSVFDRVVRRSGDGADFACFQDALSILDVRTALHDAHALFAEFGGVGGRMSVLEFVRGYVHGEFLKPSSRSFHLARAEAAFKPHKNNTGYVPPILFNELLQRALGVLLPPWFRIEGPETSPSGIASGAFRDWYVRTIQEHGGSAPGFVFSAVDKKRCGFLNLMAFDRALRMLAVFLETEEADRIFMQTDKDGDLRVSRSEFCTL